MIDNSDGNNIKKVNNVIKTLFYGLSDDELHVHLDLFWIGYTNFNCNNGPLNADEFIQRSKDIHHGNIRFSFLEHV